jgi:hypothetical protein
MPTPKEKAIKRTQTSQEVDISLQKIAGTTQYFKFASASQFQIVKTLST